MEKGQKVNEFSSNGNIGIVYVIDSKTNANSYNFVVYNNRMQYKEWYIL